MIGLQFGRLTVAAQLPSAGGRRRWSCRCLCGATVAVATGSLRSGNTTSCGCYHREVIEAKTLKHGNARKGKLSSTYWSWKAMVQRSTNPKNPSWKNYGGRGITVCDRWRTSFAAFLADMGERPAGLTLDRRNNDGNYEPGNCRWATRVEQYRNRRRAA